MTTYVYDRYVYQNFFSSGDLQKPVELHKAEQRWLPAKAVLKDLSEEEKVTGDLYRKFQAILNKLTPQKFQSLAEQALQLTIDTEERLKGAIDKIFTKVPTLWRACVLFLTSKCLQFF